MKLGLAALALLVAGCSAMPSRPALLASLYDGRTSAERAEDRSVAIVDSGRAICGGVWVAPDRILTAFHCVHDAGKPKGLDEANALLESLGVIVNPYDSDEDPPAPWDPTLMPVSYADRSGSADKPMSTYTATVLRFDRVNDLAILSTSFFPSPLHHDVASLSSRDIHDGDSVDVVGSTVGYAFTYLRGVVAATRPGDDEKSFKTLELAIAGVNHGNSGGGAFDSHGDLVGIADFMIYTGALGEAQGLAFYTHRDVLRGFLAAS